MNHVAGVAAVGMTLAAAWLAPAWVHADAPGARVSASPGAKHKTAVLGWQNTTRRVAPGTAMSDRIQVTAAGQRSQRTVRLMRARAGSTTWQTEWRARTSEHGRLKVHYTAPAAGSWKYRLQVTATPEAQHQRTSIRRIIVWTPSEQSAPQGPPTQAPPTPTTAGDVVYVTGDIGQCGGAADKTAALIDAATGPVVATGDLAYPSGTATDFANCYDPYYGHLKSVTFPVPGNHEYYSGGSAYFDYFGSRVGTAVQPWYVVDIAGWRFYMLNSNCDQVGGCGAGSAQYTWLEDQLRNQQPRCTAAVWHHPRWSSGVHGPDPITAPLYALLADRGADLLLTGHEHNYERFTRLDASGTADPTGIREFVVGTGGQALREIPGLAAGSQARLSDSHGVLRLTLRADEFDWRFLPTDPDASTDVGSERCN